MLGTSDPCPRSEQKTVAYIVLIHRSLGLGLELRLHVSVQAFGLLEEGFLGRDSRSRHVPAERFTWIGVGVFLDVPYALAHVAEVLVGRDPGAAGRDIRV